MPGQRACLQIEDGQRAVEIAVESNPDVILVDVDAGTTEDSAICGWLRDEQALCHDVNVVFAIDPKQVQGIAKLGASHTVYKPIEAEQLTASIEQVLRIAMVKKEQNDGHIVPPLAKWGSMDKGVLRDIDRIFDVIDSFEDSEANIAQVDIARDAKDEPTPRAHQKPNRRNSKDVKN